MNQNIEAILDKLLKKELTEKEIDALRQELPEGVSLKAFNEHDMILKGIDAYGVQQLRKELSEIHEKHYGVNSQKSKNGILKKKWLWFLLVLLGTGVAWFINKQNQKAKSPDQIFAEYYKPYDYATTTRNSDQQSLFTLSLLYQEKKYNAFIEQFEKYHKNRTDLNSDLILASGIAYLESNQPYKAIFQFNKIIENKDFNFEDQAIWYKSLALFKANEYNQCSTELEKLINNIDSEYHAESSALMRDLNTLKLK